ncbi:MAG TPA: hypothetical protein VIV65_08715 [Gemmatimonadaceae bacterium]
MKQIGSVVAGCVCALLVLEGALRAFESRVAPPPPRILSDSFHSPSVAISQLEEGVSVAHFSSAGARLTGHPAIEGAPTVVILGDSYVMAREVGDAATMGAQLEALARADRLPINVRQYGWSGASPAQYLLVAPQILARWRPLRVIVALSSNDLDHAAMTGEWPRLAVDAAGEAQVIGDAMDTTNVGGVRSALGMLASHRTTALLLRAPKWTRRFLDRPQVGQPTRLGPNPTAVVDPSDLTRLPSAVVRGLASSYGPRLTLVYLADVGPDSGQAPAAIESRLLDACRAESVDCVSTRSAMLEARSNGIIGRGLETRELGRGHLNPDGHQIVASVMWRTLRSSAALPAGSHGRE